MKPPPRGVVTTLSDEPHRTRHKIPRRTPSTKPCATRSQAAPARGPDRAPAREQVGEGKEDPSVVVGVERRCTRARKGGDGSRRPDHRRRRRYELAAATPSAGGGAFSAGGCGGWRERKGRNGMETLGSSRICRPLYPRNISSAVGWLGFVMDGHDACGFWGLARLGPIWQPVRRLHGPKAHQGTEPSRCPGDPPRLSRLSEPSRAGMRA